MKKLSFILVGIVLAWASTLFVVPKIIMPLVASIYDECGSDSQNTQAECNNRFGRLGQTGDLFGATTSLFSALGLFAVAFSVWSESRSARTARKPLIVCTLEQDGISLDRPDFEHKSVRISIDALIKNIGDPALNVCVIASIITRGAIIHFKKTYLAVPLATSGEDRLELKLVLQNDEFSDFFGSLMQPGSSAELSVQLTYSSLERVSWETKVAYVLDCENHSKTLLSALQGNSLDQFDSHWANGAIAAIEASVKPNSWEHLSVEID